MHPLKSLYPQRVRKIKRTKQGRILGQFLLHNVPLKMVPVPLLLYKLQRIVRAPAHPEQMCSPTPIGTKADIPLATLPSLLKHRNSLPLKKSLPKDSPIDVVKLENSPVVLPLLRVPVTPVEIPRVLQQKEPKGVRFTVPGGRRRPPLLPYA